MGSVTIYQKQSRQAALPDKEKQRRCVVVVGYRVGQTVAASA